MSAFARYIGIGYSGAETADSSLAAQRVYVVNDGEAPVEVTPPPPGKYWSRQGIAEWLVDRLAGDVPTLVGIDHGFSFPLPISSVTGWRWTGRPFSTISSATGRPTRSTPTSISCATAYEGNGAARQGNKNWRRLCEERAGGTSVFHFHAPGSMAKATHAGLPWLRFIRRKLGDHVHFWPFDGWDVPAGRSTIAEVYPALWNQDFANDELTRDQQDAFSIAAFLSRADADGSLIGLLAPDLTDAERKLAEIEGWILGAAGPAAESRTAPKAARPRTWRDRVAIKGPIVPGYTNSNGQTVLRRVYVLGCQWCGLQYEANVADIRQMRCPECHRRAPGLAH